MLDFRLCIKGYEFTIRIGKCRDVEEHSFVPKESVDEPVPTPLSDEFNRVHLEPLIRKMLIEEYEDVSHSNEEWNRIVNNGAPVEESMSPYFKQDDFDFPEPTAPTLKLVNGIIGETSRFNEDMITAIAIDYEAGRLTATDLYHYAEAGRITEDSEEEVNSFDASEFPDLMQEVNDAFDENSDINTNISLQKAQFEKDLLRFGVPADIIQDMPFPKEDPNNMPCGTEIIDEYGGER